MEKSRLRKKKKLGSYPSISVILSITLALFVIGLFGLLLLFTNKLTTLIQENVEIQVYLDKGTTENQRIKILKTLSSKPYTLDSDEKTVIQFVSKEEAAELFIKETGEDFHNLLGENPLRDAYTLKINPEYQESTELKKIKKDIEAINGVYEAEYVASLVDSINQNITKISLFLVAFAIILLIAVVILINNTIKLALFSQRFLIRSMQLVGAKASFVQKPFLIKALLYGLFGGFLATLLLVGLINYGNQHIEGLQAVQDTNQIVTLFITMLLIGGLIGFLSTFAAIRKYLKMSLDDLY